MRRYLPTLAFMALLAPATCTKTNNNVGSVADGGNCPAPKVWRYEQPGCDGQVQPICGQAGGDACLAVVCGCDGESLAGCDYFSKPYRTQGLCPGACFSPTHNLEVMGYGPTGFIKGCACDPVTDQSQCVSLGSTGRNFTCTGGVWNATYSESCGAATSTGGNLGSGGGGTGGVQGSGGTISLDARISTVDSPMDAVFTSETTVNAAVRTVTVGSSTCSDGRVLRTTEFPLASVDTNAYGIAAGTDGNLWFAECYVNKIGRITPDGTITEFPLPTPDACPSGITTGPDGNLWFTELYAGRIGRISQQGSIVEFPIPTVDGWPSGIAVGPDGNLWFTERLGNKIGRISTQGTVAEFAIPPAQYANQTQEPWDIAAGKDGNLWFTYGPNIGQATPAGAIVLVPVPTQGSDTGGITAGPDGNVWFTEVGIAQDQSYSIGRITSKGIITELAGPVPSAAPGDIVAGPDGNLWFTETGAMVGRMNPNGSFAECPARRTDTYPANITVGPDGNLWLTEPGEIIRVEL